MDSQIMGKLYSIVNRLIENRIDYRFHEISLSPHRSWNNSSAELQPTPKTMFRLAELHHFALQP